MSKIVWHYTKMGNLEKIFPPKESKEYNEGKITLRFTSYKFLNDPSEGLILKKFFETNKDSILKGFPLDFKKKQFENKIQLNIFSYVFSATYLKDSFAFWNKEYAGWNGVSIGIRWHKPFFMNKNSSDSIIPSDVIYVDPYLNLKPSYNLIKKTAECLNFCYHELFPIIKNEILDHAETPMSKNYGAFDIFITVFSNMYKHKSWEYEKEVRLITGGNSFESSKIEFNDNKIKKFGYKTFDKKIVPWITLGPACNNEDVKAVMEYLRSNGYDDIQVSRSNALDLKKTELERLLNDLIPPSITVNDNTILQEMFNP